MAKPGGNVPIVRGVVPRGIPSVPVKYRTDIFAVALALACLASGYAARTFQAERIITQTRTHNLTIQEQYGSPAQTIDGAQVNQALAGLKCDAYKRGPTLICHR